MVFEDFYILHLIGREVFGRHGILLSHQVHTFYIKLVDGGTLEGDCAIVFYFQSWHFGDDICYAAILLLSESCYRIDQGIAILSETLRLNHHLLEFGFSLSHIDRLSILESGSRKYLFGVSQA